MTGWMLNCFLILPVQLATRCQDPVDPPGECNSTCYFLSVPPEVGKKQNHFQVSKHSTVHVDGRSLSTDSFICFHAHQPSQIFQ